MKDPRYEMRTVDCKDNTTKGCATCDRIEECNDSKYQEALFTVMKSLIEEIGIDSKVFLAELDMETLDIPTGKVFILMFEKQHIAVMTATVHKNDTGSILGIMMQGKVNGEQVRAIQDKYNISRSKQCDKCETKPEKIKKEKSSFMKVQESTMLH